jgi:hypothetical protein
MRDALYITGAIAAATKDTIAYSADLLDLGALGLRPDKKTTSGDLYACFQVVGAADAQDSYIFHVQTDSAAAFNVAAELTTFPQTAVSVPTGKTFRYKCPQDVDRYLRCACTPKSAGTFDATTVNTWFELGAQKV